eukprot:Sspe_Gene.1477::Locus_487_Transcript_1_1_Confidence_1.000_Length_3120::g.1477::m.1477
MGMLARECLQTVPLSGLDPIYFASNPAQMTTVLDTLCDGMRGSLGGNVVRVRCPQGGVIEVPGEAPRKEVLVYGSGSFSVVVEGPLPRCLEIEGMEVEVVPTDFDEGTVVDALQRLVDTIRERRVASSSFDAARLGRFLSRAWRSSRRSSRRTTRTALAEPRFRLQWRGSRSRRRRCSLY